MYKCANRLTEKQKICTDKQLERKRVDMCGKCTNRQKERHRKWTNRCKNEELIQMDKQMERKIVDIWANVLIDGQKNSRYTWENVQIDVKKDTENG